jgi:hypothetical protein
MGGLDGQVVTEAFDADLLRAHPIQRVQEMQPGQATERERRAYSLEEEEAIKAHLRSLGYID